MARITEIHVRSREIRITRRTAAEAAWNGRYFSFRTYDAGAERGIRLRGEDIQLDREQAARLRDLLSAFLNGEACGEVNPAGN